MKCFELIPRSLRFLDREFGHGCFDPIYIIDFERLLLTMVWIESLKKRTDLD